MRTLVNSVQNLIWTTQSTIYTVIVSKPKLLHKKIKKQRFVTSDKTTVRCMREQTCKNYNKTLGSSRNPFGELLSQLVRYSFKLVPFARASREI